MTSGEPLTPDEVVLLTPCVKVHRYEFNRGDQLSFGSRRDDNNQLEPYVVCAGMPSEECVGGSMGWPPDPITEQVAFALAMDGICVAKHRFTRQKNGKTTLVEAENE